MRKEELRAELKNDRKILTAEEISHLSYKIEKALFTLDEINNAGIIMVYSASFNEPRTHRIIKRLFDMGKRVVLPVTDINKITITPAEIFADDNFKHGAYGILEPECVRETEKSEIDTVLVPGIGFDTDGNRMGFGGGYYDRFLSDFAGFKIGICYDFQIVKKIPVKANDVPMDAVVTESRIVRRRVNNAV